MFSLRKVLRGLFVFVALSFGAATVAQADPIITPVGTVGNRINIDSNQYGLVRFTLSNAYTNVSIAVSLTANTAGITGTAFLTNQVGPGTTLANQLASNPFNFAVVSSPFTVSYVSLFSGLTLDPGNYFVVYSSTNPNQFVSGVTGGGGVTFATAPGVSVGTPQFSNFNRNPAFPPASTFFTDTNVGNSFFTVDGTLAPTAVPEPATMLLLGTGLAGVTLKARRRCKAAQRERG